MDGSTRDRAAARRRGHLNHWRDRASTAENEVRKLRAAAAQTEGAVSFMLPTSGNMYNEAAILRLMLARWDRANWSELCMLTLRGRQVARDPAHGRLPSGAQAAPRGHLAAAAAAAAASAAASAAPSASASASASAAVMQCHVMCEYVRTYVRRHGRHVSAN